MNQTQREMVMRHLKKHKTITSWEAITLYKITRLSAIIFNLRSQGIKIYSMKQYKENKWWSVYQLMKDKDEN